MDLWNMDDYFMFKWYGFLEYDNFHFSKIVIIRMGIWWNMFILYLWKKGLVLLQHHDPQWNSDRPWQTVKQVILPMLLRCFGPRLDTWSVETQGRAPQSTGSFLLSWQWASLGPATQGIARSEGLWRWASRIQTHPSPAETDLEPLKT